ANREVTEWRRIHIPSHGMASRPVAVRHGADIKRHFDAEPGIEARAAHLGEIPIRTEIARAHFGTRLKTAARDYHGLAADLNGFSLALHLDAAYAAVVVCQQCDRRAFVENLDSVTLACLVLVFHQAGASAPGFRGEPAPELEFVADLLRLAPEARLKLNA